MPTNRLNISLVGDNIVPDIIGLRKNLEELTGKRLSLSDVVKVVLVTRKSDKLLAEVIGK